jgi:RNA polymerase sigma factor (sigma-70 family)
MDKLAYHLNKKKKPAKTEGKFLYYYPCNSEDKANFHIWDKRYIEIEVTENEWEALRELDRFEYNNEHKSYRHNEPFPENDERLSRREQKKWTDKDIPFSTVSNERIDRLRTLSTLTPQERTVYCLAVDEDMKQKDIAEDLGITQGAVSATFNRARRKLDSFDLNADNTPEDIVWKLWQIFMRDWELPDFLDIEIEFVIRGIFSDLLPFINWFYSIGELCRYILRYYLFDENKISADIENYLSSAPHNEQRHFKDYYVEQPPIIQGVYVRLCMEVNRREANKLQDSHKAVDGIYTAVEKIAKRLDTSIEECLTQRLYPFLAEKRNKRLKEFYKYYTDKKLSV